MGVVTFTHEFTISIAPARMLKAVILENHVLLPKLMSQHIKSIDIVGGTNGVRGCVKQTNFADGAHFNYVKHRLDELDLENLCCKYSLIEGDALTNHQLERIDYEIQFEATPTGGKGKATSHYHTKGDLSLNEEEIKRGKEKAAGMFKALEQHLVDNPDVCA